jgi:hypothetical protein
MTIQVSYQIPLACVRVYWHALCHWCKQSVLASWPRETLTLTSSIKSGSVFRRVFFTLPICLLLDMNHIKKFGFIQWHRCIMKLPNVGDLLPLLLLLLSLFLFYIRVYWDRKCCPVSLDATEIRVLPGNFRISSLFPSLVKTLRLLDSFLLQTWCAEISTSPGNAWIHKNSSCAILYHSQTNLP